MVVFLLTDVLSRIFHKYGDVAIARERLQNLGLCSAPLTFEHAEVGVGGEWGCRATPSETRALLFEIVPI